MSRLLLPLLLFLPGGGILAQTPELAPMRVTFLGTGAPPPSRDRMGPSTLVEAGPHKLVFDVGRGASTSIRELGVTLGAVTGVFLTHLHPDHVVGLPDLWLTGHHTRGGWARRTGPLRVWGPVGTESLLSGLEEAYAGAAGYWALGEDDIAFDWQEFSGDGVVFEEAGVRVTAFRVPHGSTTDTRAYGYRIDVGDQSVVISGDTGESENLIEHAAGADLLIHEIFYVAGSSDMDPAFRAQLEVSHTVPEAAGRVFTRVAPQLAVGTHLGNPDDQLDEIEAGVRTSYSGPFLLARDLVTIEVGDSVRIVQGVGTSEVRIRTLRERSNAAIARQDVPAIVSFLDEEFQLTAGAGWFLRGRSEMGESFARQFAEFEDAAYVRTPESVEASTAAPLAWETGSWVGTWTTPEGPLRTGGRYAASWREVDGEWKIRSELFVTLFCDGEGC